MRSNRVEQALRLQLENALGANTPDVWERLRSAAAEEIGREKKPRSAGRMLRRSSLAVMPLLGIVVVAVCAATLVGNPGFLWHTKITAGTADQVISSTLPAQAASSVPATAVGRSAASSARPSASKESAANSPAPVAVRPADNGAVFDIGGHLAKLAYATPDNGFVASYNTFGYDLLQKLNPSNSNVFMSPASVYLALGMTYNGASGQTAAEFAKLLGASGSLDGFNRNCRSLQSLMDVSSFKLANSVWLAKKYAAAIDAGFLARDKSAFGASVFGVNFDSSQTPLLISDWVSKNTNGLLRPKITGLDSSTVMTLVNTVYFKANWSFPFEQSLTATGSFQTPGGTKTVQFMKSEMCYDYCENDLLQGLVIPYADQKTAMLVLLPKKNLADMLGRLTPSEIAGYARGDRMSTVDVSLKFPKMKLRYQTILNQPLQALGLRSAFSDQADFSGMSRAIGGLYLSKVGHESVLNVDETGTEAAAVTTVIQEAAGAPVPISHIPKIMNVNHPFFLAIVNTDTGAVLFEGAVSDPTAS